MPNNIYTYRVLGFIYSKVGEIEKAKNMYLKVLELHPYDEDALFSLGSVFYKLGDIGNAIISWEKSLPFKKFSKDSIHNLSILYTELKKWGELIRIYRKFQITEFYDKNNDVEFLSSLDVPHGIVSIIQKINISDKIKDDIILDVLNFCKKTKETNLKIGLTYFLFSGFNSIFLKNANSANDNVWLGNHKFDIFVLSDLITNLRENQTDFIDVGSGDGEKLFASILLGFDNAYGIENDDFCVTHSLSIFKNVTQIAIKKIDAFEVKKDFFDKNAFIYMYSPYKDNSLMAKLFYKVMQDMRDDSILLEVFFGYAHELSVITSYDFPDYEKRYGIAIKKKNNKFFYKMVKHYTGKLINDTWQELKLQTATSNKIQDILEFDKHTKNNVGSATTKIMLENQVVLENENRQKEEENKRRLEQERLQKQREEENKKKLEQERLQKQREEENKRKLEQERLQKQREEENKKKLEQERLQKQREEENKRRLEQEKSLKQKEEQVKTKSFLQKLESFFGMAIILGAIGVQIIAIFLLGLVAIAFGLLRFLFLPDPTTTITEIILGLIFFPLIGIGAIVLAIEQYNAVIKKLRKK